jgi:mannose-6-phosphate isomerase-like protein (cupin superfamily)
MAEIYHVVDIECAESALFHAITNETLLSQWWLPKVKADPQEGGLNEFWAGKHVYNRMRITLFDPPSKLEWLCENEDSSDPWKNTRILFHFESRNNLITTLHFHHLDWKEKSPFFGQCSFHWGRHLYLLKNLCESGSQNLTDNEDVIADKANKTWQNKKVPVVNLEEKLTMIQEHWSPKIVADLNGQHVKLAKLEGEFVWHSHKHEDELFLVLRGELIIELRSGQVVLGPGELYVVPKGVEHKPIAIQEVSVMLFEPSSTLNTGNVDNELTNRNLEKL